jgi:hypothetical protein
MNYRLIPLTKGAAAKVDEEDYATFSSLKWSLTDTGYARRTVVVEGKKKNQRLHRVIMQSALGRPLRPGEQVDHRNGDRLDNRRSNLRLATHSQNSQNTRRINKHGFMGVGKNHSRFYSKIMVETQIVYVGTFDTPEEAGWMRDQWALELHGDFASLNFEYV